MTDENQSVDQQRHRIGDQFERSVDPLQAHDSDFKEMEEEGVEPFEMFLEDIIRESTRMDSTVEEYERHIRQFKQFVSERDRHPACAADTHVIKFAEFELNERGNSKGTLKTKLRHVNKAFEYFQNENVFPHSKDYSPIDSAWEKIFWPDEVDKEFPKVTRLEMRKALENVTHIFKRAVILIGLKLGLRQGEIRNIQLRDLHLSNTELQRHYSDLGTHRRLNGRKNAIFVPSKHNRDGNKSVNPRVLPLDDELRKVLTKYLLIRPECNEPWLFVSQTHHEKIQDKDGLNRHWREQLRPHIQAEDFEKELTSHFGRHWFSTYWKMEQDLGKEYVQYMRGDKIGDGKDSDSINEYLHAYYPDIEEEYRAEIYKLLP